MRPRPAPLRRSLQREISRLLLLTLKAEVECKAEHESAQHGARPSGRPCACTRCLPAIAVGHNPSVLVSNSVASVLRWPFAELEHAAASPPRLRRQAWRPGPLEVNYVQRFIGIGR